MSKALDYVLQVEAEWTRAIEIRSRLQREVQVLREENSRLKAGLERRAAAHRTLMNKNKNLATANALLGGERADNREIKSRMNHLIREVGVCISQLKRADERRAED